jgi:hypothetical protein
VKRGRVLGAVLVVAAAAWVAHGAAVRSRRADRPPPPPGEIRGAWHVHTTASDGREPLEEVVRAARDAGLQFVVITDHNLRTPAAPEYRDGVLVVPGTEVSSPLGHVAALGLPRALTEEERRDPFGSIAALGGRAVLAHPLHPRRPFRGDWADPRVAAVEPVSNDSLWGNVVARRRVRAFAAALLALPWDSPQAVLALYDRPDEELRRYDALVGGGATVALLCSADAHGWPSYLAAFEAFSMHLPLTPSGDAARDADAVAAALLDGRGTCVFDGVAPAWGARLVRDGGALRLRAPEGRAEWRVFRDGERVREGPVDVPPGGLAVCEERCGGAWRVEFDRGGRPWIFTNPVHIE